MDLTITSEKYGGSDMSWLGSRRGVGTARSITLDKSKFTGLTDSIVKAGTPVELASDGKAVPFASGKLEGFILADVSVAKADQTVALLDHGRINTQHLPVAFTVPETATNFVFVGGNKES